MTNPPDDFVGAVEASRAAEAAREAALAPPPRPQRRTNEAARGSYTQTALENELQAVRDAPFGQQNDTLNKAAFNLGQLVGAGALDEEEVKRLLFEAAVYCGHVKRDGARQARSTINSGLHNGKQKPRDLSEIGVEKPSLPKKSDGEWSPPPDAKAGTPTDGVRTIKMVRGSSVPCRVPMWVWEYDDVGRIQLGTLTLFAGKSAAGKSTAVRWFAARITRGELPGVWFGHPMKVAPIFLEEQTDAIVAPSLRIAGADMDNVVFPEFMFNGMNVGFNSLADEQALTEELQYHGVRVLIVDPIMSTFSGRMDVHRNNEVRQALAPFTRIAEAINGIVIGVTHLKKGEVRDVLDGINGSAAFGEVPRAVFGFAPTDSGEHVFEQVKNSAGQNGLRLTYQLPIKQLTNEQGQLFELPRFEIIGPSEISIADINPNDDSTTDIGTATQWLQMYLLEHQPAPSAQVKRDAKQHGDIKEWTLKRAMKRLGVRVFTRSEPGKPHTTVWALPGF